MMVSWDDRFAMIRGKTSHEIYVAVVFGELYEVQGRGPNVLRLGFFKKNSLAERSLACPACFAIYGNV